MASMFMFALLFRQTHELVPCTLPHSTEGVFPFSIQASVQPDDHDQQGGFWEACCYISVTQTLADGQGR